MLSHMSIVHLGLLCRQHLGSKLLFAKPDDPNEFLITELEAMQAVNAGEESASTVGVNWIDCDTFTCKESHVIRLACVGQKQVELFTEADLRAMFSMYDVTRKGVISKEQFVSGTSWSQQRAALQCNRCAHDFAFRRTHSDCSSWRGPEHRGHHP